MIATGLNWTVEKQPIFDKRGKELSVLGTFRSDTDEYLGTVGSNYQIVQNDELFRMPEQLVKSGLDIKFAGAGEFDGGESVYVKYKLPYTIDVAKIGDIVDTFLMIKTKHDGRGSVITKLYLERLVCTNGLTTKEGQMVSYVRHSASAQEKLEEIKKVILRSGQDVEVFGNLANTLAKVNLTMDDTRTMLEKVYYVDDTHNLYTNTQRQDKARAVLAIFEANDNDEFKKQRGTAWAFFNAFTNYTDHRTNYRISGNETSEQARVRNTVFGVGEVFKWTVLNIVCQIVSENHNVKIPEQFLGV